jgi:hypothetical protein
MEVETQILVARDRGYLAVDPTVVLPATITGHWPLLSDFAG